jgi:hypothetical protein
MLSAVKPVLLTTSTYREGVLSIFLMRLFRPFDLLHLMDVCYATFLFESILGSLIAIIRDVQRLEPHKGL